MSYASPAAVEQVLAWLKRERVRTAQAPSFNLTGSPAQIAVLRSLLAMSRTEFDDSDPGNLPVLFDPEGTVLPKDHPLTVAAAQAYLTQTTRDEREAWFRVTCLNSRDGETLQKFSKVRSLIEHALRPTPAPPGYTLYSIAPDGRSITCHACGSTSYNLNDVRHRFCGHCNLFHDDPR